MKRRDATEGSRENLSVLVPADPKAAIIESDPVSAEAVKKIAAAFLDLARDNVGTRRLEFANRYGLLGIERTFNFGTVRGEERDQWTEEIHHFWRHFQDWGRLGRYPEQYLVYLPAKVVKELGEGPGSAKRQRDYIRARLIGLVTSKLQSHVGATMLFDPVNRAYALTYQPKNLLGLLWLHVARVASREHQSRWCAYQACGAKLEDRRADGRKRRTDSDFCGDECRTRHHNARIAAAKKNKTAASR